MGPLHGLAGHRSPAYQLAKAAAPADAKKDLSDMVPLSLGKTLKNFKEGRALRVTASLRVIGP